MARPRKIIDEKRLNVKMESEKHEDFRLACEHAQISMSDAILDLVDGFIALNLPQKVPTRRTVELDEGPGF